MNISKRILAVASIGLASLPWVAEAWGADAACVASGSKVRLTQAQINTLVLGNVVCGRPGASYPGNASDKWQEEHLTGTDLYDYKQGPGNAVDPRERVGRWTTTASGSRTTPDTITHAYSPTLVFTWAVFGPVPNVPGTSVYSFCTAPAGAEHVRAYVITSSSGCGGNYPGP